MKRRALVVTLLTVVALASLGAQGRRVLVAGDSPAGIARARTQAVMQAALDQTGYLDGVAYRIVVPANWNGTLLVYAHGYGEGTNPPALVPPQIDPKTTPLMTRLLSQGFALAASQMAGSGFQVKEGMQDTVALTSAFRDMVGKPRRTIIWGRSLGGLTTLAMIEKFPGIYDGAIALCPPASGTPRRFDLALDVALAYAVTFGWHDEWGTPGDMRDDNLSALATEVQNDILQHHWTPPHPGKALAVDRDWEFIRLVTHMPPDTFYVGANRVMPVLFATAVRAELENRAGGPISDNIGRTYTLSEDDFLALEALGLERSATLHLLERMNWPAHQYTAPPNARNYVEHYFDPSGRINRPVLTLHTEGDALAIPNHEAAYAKVVDDAGNTDLLMQQFVKGGSHCSFTAEQVLAAVSAMMEWLDKGQKPDPKTFFSPAAGFDPSYDLAKHPWPWVR